MMARGMRLLLLLAAFTLARAVTDVTYDHQWPGAFHAQFCITMTRAVFNWKAHVLFDRPVDKLEMYMADVERKLDGGKEYVVVPKTYNTALKAGESFCVKFAAHSAGANPPATQFYIENYDEPAAGVSHATSAPDSHDASPTTSAPSSHSGSGSGHYLWEHLQFDPHNPLKSLNVPSHGHFDEDSLSVVDDPAGGGAKVLRVYYEKNHYIHLKPHRGAQFYTSPLPLMDSLTFTYDIYFSPGFPWVKGGKLPGLYGGAYDCSGGRHSEECFSARLMWRENGDGEMYAYILENQTASFCQRQDIHCNFEYGNSLGRGAWRWTAGRWQTISEHITLNTPGHMDGLVKVWLDGKLVYHLENLNFRKTANMKIGGIFFSTFFGGSTADWAPPTDCYTYFKNFRLSNTPEGPPPIVG